MQSGKPAGSENNTVESKEDPAYLQYAITLRKLPSDELKKSFEQDQKHLTEASKESKARVRLTNTEKKAVLARKTWSDVVSLTHAENAKTSEANKAIVVERLQKLGYKNADEVMQKIISYLQNRTVITVAFRAGFLAKPGLVDFQLSTIFDRRSLKSEKYISNRDQVEKDLYSALPEPTKGYLLNHYHARPRYGALVLLARDNPISDAGKDNYYGHSFVVFKQRAKLNCLFAPHDTVNQAVEKMSSFSHMEQLLAICSDNKLEALAKRVMKGVLQGYFIRESDADGYIETQLPAVDFLDPNLVEHIHIDTEEYTLTSEELIAIRSRGIAVTNSKGNPYPALHAQFMQYVEKGDAQQVKILLQDYPSLIFTCNRKDEEAIHIALRLKHYALVKPLLARGASLDDATLAGISVREMIWATKKLKLIKLLSRENKRAKKIKTVGEIKMQASVELVVQQPVQPVGEKPKAEDKSQLPPTEIVKTPELSLPPKTESKVETVAVAPKKTEAPEPEFKGVTDVIKTEMLADMENLKKSFEKAIKDYSSDDKMRLDSIAKIRNLFNEIKECAVPNTMIVLGCIINELNQAQAVHSAKLFKLKGKSEYTGRLEGILSRFAITSQSMKDAALECYVTYESTKTSVKKQP